MREDHGLRILLLGSPAVFNGDQPLQIQRRLLRWLLFYLACQKEMVGRSDLILLFWPDASEEDGRRHLREMLSKLRAQMPDPEIIITEQDQVGLDFEKVYSDVIEFQSLFSQTARACAQTPASTPLTQAVHQKVLDAVRLWRSGRFMSGVSLPESESLNDWILSTSQQLETQRLRLLDRLVEHDTASGDVEGALHWLQSALEGDETNESLHYRTLQIIHQQGRYSEALNYCTYLQELFRREGFSELPPSLLSMARQIREEASRPAAESGSPAWPSLADLQVPFTGQHALLKELQFAIRRGSPMIVFGEAGSGKSRLVRELFFSMKPAPRLLLAPARVMETRLPFQPIIDMLRHDIQAEEWIEMDPVWVTPLVKLLPELQIMRPEIKSPSIAPQDERSLTFEALRQLFLYLGRKQPYLLFLDNAQWSDEETLSALAYLAERGLSEQNGALLLAARAEEVSPQLNTFLNRPRSAYSVQRFHLPPLNRDEISTLARYVLAEAFQPDVVERLERETGGNPLFLLETLRLVLDYSLSTETHEAIVRLPLASAIHTVIRERLQHLTPNDAQVLTIAAVIGSPFSTELLEATSHLPPEQVAQSLESLVQVNLIQADLHDRPSSGYTFVHEKVREVVLLDLSPVRKRLFHMRIARALDKQQQGQSVEVETQLAEHYTLAGELNSAFQHWLRASLYAWRTHDKSTAVSALESAEKILQRLEGQGTDVSIYQLYRQWGRLASDLSDPAMLEQVFERLLRYGQRRQNSLLVGSAYNGLAQAAAMRMQPKLGIEILNKAIPFLEQSGRLFEHIEARNHRAVFLMQTGQYRDAQTVLEEALHLAERASDAQSLEARALTQYWQSVMLMLSGWPMLALEVAEKSARDVEEAFSPIGEVRAVKARAAAQLYMGKIKDSLKAAEAGLAQAVEMKYPLLTGEMHGAVAQASLAGGDLDGCWEHLHQARKFARQFPYSYLEEKMLGTLGRLYHFLGDLEEAQRAYQQGQGETANYYALNNRIAQASLMAEQGEITPAMEILEGCIEFTLRNQLLLPHFAAALAKANIYILQNKDEAARTVLATAGEARQRRLPEFELQFRLLEARLALRAGQPEQAADAARSTADKAQSLGYVLLEVSACRLWQPAAAASSASEAEKAAQRLADRLNTLCQNTNTPEIQTRLVKLQESVDKTL